MADAKVEVEVNLDPLKQAAELSEALHQHWKNLEEVIKRTSNELRNFAAIQKDITKSVRTLDEPIRRTRRKLKTKDEDIDEALGVASQKTRKRDTSGRFITDYYKKTGLPPGATYTPEPKTDIYTSWMPKGAHFAPDLPPGYRSKPGAANPSIPQTSAGFIKPEDRELNTRFKLDSLKHFRDFHKYIKDFANVALSGNLGILARPLAALGPVGIGAAAVAETAHIIGGATTDYRREAAEAGAYGITPKALETFENQFKDVLGEGGGKNLFGEILRQKTAGPGQPELFKAWMAQYGQTVTGTEKQEDLADKFLKAQEMFAKNVDPNLWKTLSENMNLHLDMGTLTRMREAPTGELDKSIERERKERNNRISKEADQNIKNFGASWRQIFIDLNNAFLGFIGTVVGPNAIPKGIGKGAVKAAVPIYKANEFNVSGWIWDKLKGLFGIAPAKAGELNFNERLNKGGDKSTFGDIPVTPGLLGKEANMPSQFAQPKSLETVAKQGEFIIPGQDKIPQNIQDIRDAIIDSNKLLETLTKSKIDIGGNTGIGGVPGYGEEGGPPQIYYSGGMGEAGEPKGLARGGGGMAGSRSTGGEGGGEITGGEGIGGKAPKMTESKKQVAALLVDKFRKAGATEEGIAGMMANIQSESKFDPTTRHFDQPKFRGTEAENAHGLWQMGGTEWNRYAAWLQKNHPGANWADPGLQADWQIENLQKNYPKVWKEMTSHTSASQQAGDFVSGYEHPAKQYEEQRRAQYSKGVPSVESYTGGVKAPSNSIARTAIEKASGEKTKNKEPAMPHKPTSVNGATMSLNDMNTFQNVDRGKDIQIFNKSGANIVMQTAQLGLASGSFNT